MVNILDLFYAVVKQFKAVVPEAKHYVGKIPEGYSMPSFLYILVFNGDTRSSFHTKNVLVDLQIIYFGKLDEYGQPSFEDKLNTMHELKGFLSQFHLDVGDRNLKFSYNFGEADDQLTIDLQFRFNDTLVNLAYHEQQAREMIETIYINEEEVI